MKKKALNIFILSFCLLSVSGQELIFNEFGLDTIHWWKLDLEKDDVPGISWNKVLAHLSAQKKVPKATVKIAVLDTDFDLKHKALQGLIWKNQIEITNNDLDDDKNGYVDDSNGWNFLGLAEKDSSLAYVLVEESRILRNFDSLSFIKYKKRKRIPYNYKDVMSSYDSTVVSLNRKIQPYKEIEPDYTFVIDTLKKLIKKDITLENLVNYKASNDTIRGYVDYAKYYYENGFAYNQFKDYLTLKENSLNICMNLNYDPSSVLDTKSNYEQGRFNGNNSFGLNKHILKHGTQVSGVIASSIKLYSELTQESNSLNYPITIIPITFTGIGDFSDKDFYLAFKYAIDNGAKILNLSQSKAFSINPKILKKALDIAERKNVLVIMSAGNNSSNLDKVWRFPQTISKIYRKEFSNTIVVGATTNLANHEIVDKDSNYGQNIVDVFAPGVNILTSIPNNSYDKKSGTSYAAPIVTNLAALIWSYYPELKAREIKDIIIKSGSTFDFDVNVPKEDNPLEESSSLIKLLPFNQLSKSGKIVNAYNALILAEKVAKR